MEKKSSSKAKITTSIYAPLLQDCNSIAMKPKSTLIIKMKLIKLIFKLLLT